MAVVIKRVTVVVDKVITVNVIDKAIAVIVNSVASNLARIDPDVGG